MATGSAPSSAAGGAPTAGGRAINDAGASGRSPGYRYDLDGLRGVAIALVVVFHVFVGRVSGGVDVFLFLSGFFFVGSQLRRLERPGASLNPWWPLWRTLRRLVPALILTLAATVAGVVLVARHLLGTDLAEQVAASAGYAQNWVLYAQDREYAAASGDASPLQHLWSMAVQGQFYLLIIGLTVGLAALRRLASKWDGGGWRLSGPAIGIIAAASLASFVYAAILVGVDQPLNYYSTFTRFWELGLGALLAVGMGRARLSGIAGAVVSAVGLALVVVSGLVVDGAATFPGPAALVPVGGAALVVLGSGPANRLLAARPLARLGGMAYSLYLWHWPLLIVSLAALGLDEPNLGLGVVVVAASLGLAWLTERFVERPLRQRARPPKAGERRAATAAVGLRAQPAARGRAAGGVAVAAGLVAALATPVGWHGVVANELDDDLDPVAYPGALALYGAPVEPLPPKPDYPVLSSSQGMSWDDGCMGKGHEDTDRLPRKWRGPDWVDCVYGDPDAETTVVALGGSHTDHWLGALDPLGKEHGFRVFAVLREQCPSFVTDYEGVYADGCEEFNETVLGEVEELRPDLVFTTATRPLGAPPGPIEGVPASYVTLWNWLLERGIPAVAVRDTPWFQDEEGNPWSSSACVEAGGGIEGCSIPAEDFYLEENPAALLGEIEGFTVVDPEPWFCPDGTCLPVIGNRYVYVDPNHVARHYAASLAPMLWESLGPALEEAQDPGIAGRMRAEPRLELR